jgi:hypothetical protein
MEAEGYVDSSIVTGSEERIFNALVVYEAQVKGHGDGSLISPR